MNALQQDRSPLRHVSGAKPLLVGVLACGALLVTAPSAMAYHVMANGMMCPHAAGEAVPGEAPPTVNPSAAPNAAPIGAATATAKPTSRPAAKPSVQPKAQQPATQAQAQQPAQAQAQAQSQAQRPAVASAPATRAAMAPVPVKTRSTTTVRRQVPVAVQTLRTVKAERPVAERMNPLSADPLRLARGGAVDPIERMGAVDAGQPASPALGTLLLALLALAGMGVAAALVIVGRRMARDARSAAIALPFVDETDAVEAELQEMILEARTRTLLAPEGLEDVDDAPAVSTTH